MSLEKTNILTFIKLKSSLQYADYKEKSLKLLSREGQYVAINGAASFWVRQFTIGQKKNQKLVIVDPNSKDLEELAGMVTESGFR